MKWWTPVLNSAPSQSGKEDDFPEKVPVTIRDL